MHLVQATIQTLPLVLNADTKKNEVMTMVDATDDSATVKLVEVIDEKP